MRNFDIRKKTLRASARKITIRYIDRRSRNATTTIGKCGLDSDFSWKMTTSISPLSNFLATAYHFNLRDRKSHPDLSARGRVPDAHIYPRDRFARDKICNKQKTRVICTKRVPLGKYRTARLGQAQPPRLNLHRHSLAIRHSHDSFMEHTKVYFKMSNWKVGRSESTRNIYVIIHTRQSDASSEL